MLLLAALTIAGCATVCGRQHCAAFKSLKSADRECNQYLGCEDCSVRCQGLLHRFWNDTSGLPDVIIGRLYRPDWYDYDYRTRTQQCLSEVASSVALKKSCCRATCSVQCYHDQYGQLDKEKANFVPFTDLQHIQVVLECAAILGTSKYTFFDVVRYGVLAVPEGRCLLRCFLLREGLYSDADGPDLDRIHVQCGGYDDGAAFRRNAWDCLERLREEPLDKCTLAARVAIECVNANNAIVQIFVNSVAKFLPSLFANIVESSFDGMLNPLFSPVKNPSKTVPATPPITIPPFPILSQTQSPKLPTCSQLSTYPTLPDSASFVTPISLVTAKPTLPTRPTRSIIPTLTEKVILPSLATVLHQHSQANFTDLTVAPTETSPVNLAPSTSQPTMLPTPTLKKRWTIPTIDSLPVLEESFEHYFEDYLEGFHRLKRLQSTLPIPSKFALRTELPSVSQPTPTQRYLVTSLPSVTPLTLVESVPSVTLPTASLSSRSTTPRLFLAIETVTPSTDLTSQPNLSSSLTLLPSTTNSPMTPKTTVPTPLSTRKSFSDVHPSTTPPDRVPTKKLVTLPEPTRSSSSVTTSTRFATNPSKTLATLPTVDALSLIVSTVKTTSQITHSKFTATSTLFPSGKSTTL